MVTNGTYKRFKMIANSLKSRDLESFLTFKFTNFTFSYFTVTVVMDESILYYDDTTRSFQTTLKKNTPW
jgi:hypothetical protein